MKFVFPNLILLSSLGLLLCGARASAESPQAIVVAIVPFQYIHNEIVAQVRVNGHGPYAMLLDTGTSPSVIDLNLARQIGLTIDAGGQAGSGGGVKANPAYETSLPQVELGGVTAKNVSALALDLSGVSRKFGQPIQGVLGDSLFTGASSAVRLPAPNRALLLAFAVRSRIAKAVRRTHRHSSVSPYRRSPFQ